MVSKRNKIEIYETYMNKTNFICIIFTRSNFVYSLKKIRETLENIISINKIEKEKSNICDYLFETIA